MTDPRAHEDSVRRKPARDPNAPRLKPFFARRRPPGLLRDLVIGLVSLSITAAVLRRWAAAGMPLDGPVDYTALGGAFLFAAIAAFTLGRRLRRLLKS